ncbi:MAG: hypothetical protein ACREOD_06700 [Candidatus Dormibacteria bacterium]
MRPATPEASALPRPGGWRRLAARIPLPSLTVPLLVMALLKLPSLFEPHWYTDEAGYANTAWLMAHGKVLYLTVWNNKPPLLFWIYQVALGGFGSSSELGLHLVSGILELFALGGMWVLARGSLGGRRTWVAMLLGALLLGTPLLNGDLALPESLLIGFTVWAMVAVVAALRAPGRWRALLLAGCAGLLLGLACLIQQTAVADAFVALLILLLGRRGWELAGTTFGVLVVVIAAAMAPFVAAAGAHNVFFFLVTSYAGYTSGTLHPSLGSVAPRAVAFLLVLGGAWWARRWSPERLLVWVWLGVVLLAYIIPNRPYMHFLLPAAPAAALLLARLKLPELRRRPVAAGLRPLPLLAATLLVSGMWAAVLASGLSGGSLFTVKLTAQYYPAFVGRYTGAISPVTYVSLYDQRAVAEHQAVAWVRENGLGGQTAVVWSPDSWAYLLGDLKPILPVPPIYMDQLWLGTTTLLDRVKADRPVVIILTSDSYNQYGPIEPVLRADYTEVQSLDQGQVWIRSDVAARILSTKPASRG